MMPPLIGKLIFLGVGVGLLFPALRRAVMPRRPPRRLRDPYKPREVSQRRYSRLWVVDRDHQEDT